MQLLIMQFSPAWTTGVVILLDDYKRMRWTEHVAHTREIRNVYRVLKPERETTWETQTKMER
jgi:hypothetical protein